MDISRSTNPLSSSMIANKKIASKVDKKSEKSVSFSGATMKSETEHKRNFKFPPSDMRHYVKEKPLTLQELAQQQHQEKLAAFVPFQKLIEEHPHLDPKNKKSSSFGGISWENPEDFSNVAADLSD